MRTAVTLPVPSGRNVMMVAERTVGAETVDAPRLQPAELLVSEAGPQRSVDEAHVHATVGGIDVAARVGVERERRRPASGRRRWCRSARGGGGERPRPPQPG